MATLNRSSLSTLHVNSLLALVLAFKIIML